MNGSGKQSFYEIQLNNGSLIAAFLVAVALGVAVFILGVMVGRGQVGDPVAEDGGWVEDLGTAEGEVDPGADDPDFFDNLQENDEGADTSSSTTAPAEAPVDGEEPPTAGAQRPTGAELGLPPADPALASGYVIQVKSTPDRSDAERLQSTLAEAGFPAWVISGDVQGSTTYRVRVGRYRSVEDARVVERALRGRSDVEDTWVTQG